MKTLEGKIAAITGGGGGIGLAIAKNLASVGARVVVLDRNGEARATVLDEIPGACFVSGDATKPESFAEALKKGANDAGGLDLLVNNVGLFRRMPNDQVTAEDFNQLIAANLLTPFFLSRTAAPLMAERGEGAIVCVSSVAAYYARADQAAYCSSKAALEHLVRVLALDLAPKHIRVNAVRPGMTESEMIRDELEVAVPGKINIPLGKLGAPSDIAECVRFLALAGHMTGQIVTIDGGQTLQFARPLG